MKSLLFGELPSSRFNTFERSRNLISCCKINKISSCCTLEERLRFVNNHVILNKPKRKNLYINYGEKECSTINLGNGYFPCNG